MRGSVLSDIKGLAVGKAEHCTGLAGFLSASTTRLNVSSVPSPITVAVVEDDDDLRATLLRFLTSVGMDATGFGNVGDLDEALAAAAPDVILLDVNLPGENGFLAAARLRSRSMVGIVMLTGRTEQQDRLLGLSMGVDHYLGKPVDLRELESVIRNLARRLNTAQPETEQRAQAADATAWLLDKEGWRLTAPNGTSLDLSAAEYQALLPMLETPGQPHSRDTINARLGKPRLDADNRSLDVLVSRIRRKVELGTGLALPLRAARGAGYVFTGVARVEGTRDD